MSTINLGNQYITFDYLHPATGEDFSTLLREGIQPGIYKGGEISAAGGSSISIAPFVAYLNTSDDKMIRVETALAVNLSVNTSTPVISITFTWDNVALNYLDFNQRGTGSSPITNEVCLGTALFSGSTVIGADYTKKNWALLHNDLIVRPPLGQIQFPTTTTYSSDTYTLDAYREYTFTPVIEGTTSAGTGTYTTQKGVYTQVGDRIFFNLTVAITNHTGSGNILISGLPVACGTGINPACNVIASDLSYTGSQIGANVQAGTSTILLTQFSSGSTSSNIALDTAFTVEISGHYSRSMAL